MKFANLNTSIFFFFCEYLISQIQNIYVSILCRVIHYAGLFKFTSLSPHGICEFKYLTLLFLRVLNFTNSKYLCIYLMLCHPHIFKFANFKSLWNTLRNKLILQYVTSSIQPWYNLQQTLSKSIYGQKWVTSFLQVKRQCYCYLITSQSSPEIVQFDSW